MMSKCKTWRDSHPTRKAVHIKELLLKEENERWKEEMKSYLKVQVDRKYYLFIDLKDDN